MVVRRRYWARIETLRAELLSRGDRDGAARLPVFQEAPQRRIKSAYLRGDLPPKDASARVPSSSGKLRPGGWPSRYGPPKEES